MKKKHPPAKDLATTILATQISFIRLPRQSFFATLDRTHPFLSLNDTPLLPYLLRATHAALRTEPLVKKSVQFTSFLASWWLNHPNLKNMLVKMGIFPKVRDENTTYLKPPLISWPLFDIVCFVTGAFCLHYRLQQKCVTKIKDPMPSGWSGATCRVEPKPKCCKKDKHCRASMQSVNQIDGKKSLIISIRNPHHRSTPRHTMSLTRVSSISSYLLTPTNNTSVQQGTTAPRQESIVWRCYCYNWRWSPEAKPFNNAAHRVSWVPWWVGLLIFFGGKMWGKKRSWVEW